MEQDATAKTEPPDPALSNRAYREMILAILAAALLSGAAALVVHGAPLVARGAVSILGLAEALAAALAYALSAFIAGFAACAAGAMPLFRRLERMKVRVRWPYFALALAVTAVILAMAGSAPSLLAPQNLAHFAPGLAAAAMFSRRISRIWAAAEANAPTLGDEARDLRRTSAAGDNIPYTEE